MTSSRLLLLTALLACGTAAGCHNAPKTQSADAAPSHAVDPSTGALPPPDRTGTMTLERALATRRSVRQFLPEALTPAQLGQLAWAAQGITDPSSGHRTAPSAHAVYPLRLHLLTPDGAFVYHPEGHSLEARISKDVRAELSAAAGGQRQIQQAPCVMVLTWMPARAQSLGDRALSFVSMEAGHAAQNVLLQATAMGLGAVPMGSLDPSAVQRVLGIGNDEQPLYLIAAGRAASPGR